MARPTFEFERGGAHDARGVFTTRTLNINCLIISQTLNSLSAFADEFINSFRHASPRMLVR